MTARLEDWFMSWTRTPYSAPEQRGKTVIGRVYGDDRFDDGELVRLGRLAKSEGRIITTRKGDVFELGKPEAGYLEWLKSQGVPFDDANPVKLVEEYTSMAEGSRKS